MAQNSRFPTRVYEYIIIVILLYTYPALLDACLRRCHASDPLDRLMCRMLRRDIQADRTLLHAGKQSNLDIWVGWWVAENRCSRAKRQPRPPAAGREGLIYGPAGHFRPDTFCLLLRLLGAESYALFVQVICSNIYGGIGTPRPKYRTIAAQALSGIFCGDRHAEGWTNRDSRKGRYVFAWRALLCLKRGQQFQAFYWNNAGYICVWNIFGAPRLTPY